MIIESTWSGSHKKVERLKTETETSSNGPGGAENRTNDHQLYNPNPETLTLNGSKTASSQVPTHHQDVPGPDCKHTHVSKDQFRNHLLKVFHIYGEERARLRV